MVILDMIVIRLGEKFIMRSHLEKQRPGYYSRDRIIKGGLYVYAIIVGNRQRS